MAIKPRSKTKRSTARGVKRSIVLDIVDASSLTDADWAVINSLRRTCERGGAKALAVSLKKLVADPIRYVRVVGAFFPDMIREEIRDMLAEEGITREDLEEIVRNQERPIYLQ